MKITKASGQKVHFSEQKLRRSLAHSGASSDSIQTIVGHIKRDLYEGMPTNAIYRTAFKLLRKYEKQAASKYKLKQALMELGPTGYPFEQFIASLLEAEGFKTEHSRIFQGKCVRHEIDVVAQKADSIALIECKFHNQPGIICDVKIPLYIQSRFLDVTQNWQRDPQDPQAAITHFNGWVVTNTRFSTDAIQYGHCVGLTLMGWDYPENASLKHKINTTGIHPITCLSSLTKSEKTELLKNGIIITESLLKTSSILQSIRISKERQQNVLLECQSLTTNM